MLNRSGRYVRRAKLSIPSEVPAGRLAAAVEEGLRLATLPGENEGRSYYFRTIRVSGLPPNGDRAVWLEKFQQVLTNEALHAVHGADPNAAFAPAVYFHSHQEALEILLHRVLARRTAGEWYWPQVAAGMENAPYGDFASAEIIRAIVRKLYAQPTSWLAVAAAILAVPGLDVARLFEAIAPAEAHAWLREIDSGPPLRTPRAAAISSAARSAIEQAIRAFGTQDLRTLWLATLAVLLESPADLVAKTAVWRARVELQQITARPPEIRLAQRAPIRPDIVGVPEAFELTAALTHAEPVALPTHARPSSAEVPEPPQLPLEAPPMSTRQPDPALIRDSLPWRYAGEPTTVAGLFFLVNVLERLGVANSLAAFAGAVPDFAPRVLRRLIAQAGATPDDCIARWLDARISGPPGGDAFPCEPAWWPANLPRSCRETTVDDLVRAWRLGVRRWCWRVGRIAVRDVIVRSGVFSVNRTDLDVSLPLEGVDIRIRLAGMDLDPGWLPWFGLVVRFHYLSGMRP